MTVAPRSVPSAGERPHTPQRNVESGASELPTPGPNAGSTLGPCSSLLLGLGKSVVSEWAWSSAPSPTLPTPGPTMPAAPEERSSHNAGGEAAVAGSKVRAFFLAGTDVGGTIQLQGHTASCGMT